MMLKYNNTSGRLMAAMMLVLSIIVALASFNLATWQWAILPLLMLTLGALLISETGIASYLSASRPKHLGGMDLLRIVGGIFGGLVISGALLSIPLIGGAAPDSVTNFYGVYGGIVGGISALLSIVFLAI